MSKLSNQATKKGMILLLGVIIGIITGFVVSFALIDKFNILHKPISKEIETPQPESPADTVVKYVVHHYLPENKAQENTAQTDSLAADSSATDLYSVDFTLEDEEGDDNIPEHEKRQTTVSEPKLVSKIDIPVSVMNHDKKVHENVENDAKHIEVQFWSTPIKNKVTYEFDGNTLKIKGLSNYESLKAFSYSDKLYLQIDKKTYRIQQAKEIQRMTESQDF